MIRDHFNPLLSLVGWDGGRATAPTGRVVDLQIRTDELTRILEFHPALVTLAMLGGLGVTIVLAWTLPAGAGGAVFTHNNQTGWSRPLAHISGRLKSRLKSQRA